MNELESLAQVLRAYAFAHPWPLSGPIPEGNRRHVWLSGRLVRVQLTYTRPDSVTSSAVRLPAHRGLLQFSMSPQDDRGPLPEELVQEIRRAFCGEGEGMTEVPSILYPGVVRQFALFVPREAMP